MFENFFFECTTWKSRLRNFRAIKLVEDVEELQKRWIDNLGHGNQNAKETWVEPKFDMQNNPWEVFAITIHKRKWGWPRTWYASPWGDYVLLQCKKSIKM